MSLQIVTTSDGSQSLFVPELNEHYHSSHGAIQEALHVFIGAGLGATTLTEFSVMEVGFGTGLNALLSAHWAESEGRKIKYRGLEKYPVDQNTVEQLNYPDRVGMHSSKAVFSQMHRCPWEQENRLTPHFSLIKNQVDVLSFPQFDRVDLVFFDAFGFRAQEEMWDQRVFEWLFSHLHSGGILVTYASKGEVRRRLTRVGFVVEKLPGPVGKREMVRTIKP